MYMVFLRLRFLKLFLLAVLAVQATVFVAMCIVHQEWYLSYVRQVINILSSENNTVEAFLSTYEEYCELRLQPHPSNVAESKVSLQNKSSTLCPCISNTLMGRFNVTFDPPQIGELELAHPDLIAGGSWSPQWCNARQRVAIIIPFRDREEHLRMLLSIVHPMLQRQNLQYTIFVVEQLKPPVFNKASLMNVGFIESRAMANFDCFIFHDVDMLPEDDRNFYVCSAEPRHVGSHINKWDYEIPYHEIFGGVTAFRGEHFERTNGFSNQYYGWGGEDDDMYNRIKAQNMSILRFSKAVARYSMIKHTSDAGNPYNTKSNVAWKLRPKHYVTDGLNSLRYQIVAVEARPLYTWLLVNLPPHPSYLKSSYRGLASASTDNKSRRWQTLLVCISILFCLTPSLNPRRHCVTV